MQVFDPYAILVLNTDLGDPAKEKGTPYLGQARNEEEL